MSAQTPQGIDRRSWTARVRYDRLAALYNLVFSRPRACAVPHDPGRAGEAARGSGPGNEWRRLLCQEAAGQVLELGVGTGANLGYFGKDVELTGVDISSNMLSFARARASSLAYPARFQVADAQVLPFPDASFDCVVSSFFLCTVPDPHAALLQARRVLRPCGHLFLLEHERSSHPLLGLLLDAISPLATLLVGDHPNRHLRREVARAGFCVEEERPLWLDVVWLIRARAPLRGC